MTTAHRPTWKPAYGLADSVGRGYIPTRSYSARVQQPFIVGSAWISEFEGKAVGAGISRRTQKQRLQSRALATLKRGAKKEEWRLGDNRGGSKWKKNQIIRSGLHRGLRARQTQKNQAAWRGIIRRRGTTVGKPFPRGRRF